MSLCPEDSDIGREREPAAAVAVNSSFEHSLGGAQTQMA